MKRLASNIVLGFFILVLVILYGISKQPSTYSLVPVPKDKPSNTQNTDDVADETRAFDHEVSLPNGDTINVAIADTSLERIQGLSGVTSLNANEGMLFIFDDDGRHGIWMKNMNFDLDILWLDDTGRVVHAVERAPIARDDLALLVYQNDIPARYVLEVPSGTMAANELSVGSTVAVS